MRDIPASLKSLTHNLYAQRANQRQMILRFVNGDGVAIPEPPLAPIALPEQQIQSAGRDEAEHLCIRAFRDSDAETIRRICCETGFLGQPVEAVFQDRELFADLFTLPYLQHEPDWALVAEVDGIVRGYLLGSVAPNFDWVLMRSGARTTTRMVLRFLSGHYREHPRSARFVRWLVLRGYWEQPRHPGGSAHLHLDLETGYRGRGIGRRLWEAYELRLREAGVSRCYGAFFSHPNRRPELVYTRYGFTVFDRKRTSIFEPEMSDPVEVVCMQKSLNHE